MLISSKGVKQIGIFTTLKMIPLKLEVLENELNIYDFIVKVKLHDIEK